MNAIVLSAKWFKSVLSSTKSKFTQFTNFRVEMSFRFYFEFLVELLKHPYYVQNEGLTSYKLLEFNSIQKPTGEHNNSFQIFVNTVVLL